jgi:hypothetical protein
MPLGRPRCRWMDNIKTDLVEIGWNGVDWISLVQDKDKWRVLVNGFYKMLGHYRVATQLVTSQVVLSSIELVRRSHKNIWLCRNNAFPIKAIEYGLILNIRLVDSYLHSPIQRHDVKKLRGL